MEVHYEGKMEKEILLFVIGAVWGFIYWGNTVWNPDVQYLLQDIKHIKLPLNWHWIFDSGVHLGIAALVLAVGTLLILWILRFLSDSRNTHADHSRPVVHRSDLMFISDWRDPVLF